MLLNGRYSISGEYYWNGTIGTTKGHATVNGRRVVGYTYDEGNLENRRLILGIQRPSQLLFLKLGSLALHRRSLVYDMELDHNQKYTGPWYQLDAFQSAEMVDLHPNIAEGFHISEQGAMAMLEDLPEDVFDVLASIECLFPFPDGNGDLEFLIKQSS